MAFLAPYKVIKVHLNIDVEGYRPAERRELDKLGHAHRRPHLQHQGLSTARL
jgi:type I site-specific restriction endonuclease